MARERKIIQINDSIMFFSVVTSPNKNAKEKFVWIKLEDFS